ncbi:MAG TPA: rhomboid family intramembrane serine protease [Xanthomonadaceae bacterium]|jgi:membrane associated rhomboid family serine protease|nr:rhomboid family intramembrane serine protease [Xanthomonadaceae bacterium]
MFNHLPKATQALLWINGGMMLLQYLLDPSGTKFGPFGPFAMFNLWPIGGGGPDALSTGMGFMPWQLVTYAFLHANLNHIFFNMLALLMFGAPLEYTWGTKRFLQFYFVCVVGAGLTYLAWAALMQITGPVIGASGGVFGLLLAYGMLFPKQRVMLLFPPIPMDARTLVIGYGAIELLLGVWGTGNIAHFAHLGGMLFGWLMIRYWRGQPPFRKRPRGGIKR